MSSQWNEDQAVGERALRLDAEQRARATEQVADLRACLAGLLGLRDRLGWQCLTHSRTRVEAGTCDCWWCEAERLTK